MADANRNLSDFVAQSSRSDVILPLTHTTDVACCAGIFETALLKAQKRGSLGALAYLSYGKSTHIPNADLKLDVSERDSPIIFILRPNANYQIRRILPFDSSVYDYGDHIAYLSRNMSLSNIEIGSSLDAAARFVRLFYGDNANYINDTPDFDERPVKNGMHPPLEARDLARLLTQKAATGPDRRYYTVEVQVEEDLELYEKVIEHVVLPSFFQDPYYGHFLDIIRDKWRVEPSFYRGRRFDPARQAVLAANKADDYIQEAYLNGA